MKRFTKMLLCSVIAFSLSTQAIGFTEQARVKTGLRNKTTPELFKQLGILEMQHMNAPTAQQKDALNLQQHTVYQELVKRGEIF